MNAQKVSTPQRGVSSERPAMEALRSLVESWGGHFEHVTLSDPIWDSEEVAAAQYSAFLGVDYGRKIIYTVDGFCPGEVLHEVGHVFASLHNPAFAEEYDFFGWEFVVAQKVGLVEEWLKGTGNYSVGGTSFIEFEEMTIEEQSDLIEERVQRAVALGLIVGGEPVSVRAPT
jgi:hypothetical protein